jgi:Flp pilus assembly protein TadD
VASGKTSLVNAGVFPLMTAAGMTVLPLGRLSYGETFPFAALAPHNPYTLAVLRSWSPSEAVSRLAGRTVLDHVRSCAGRRDGPVLAAIDQLEELAADSGLRSSHRRKFLAELAEAMEKEPRLHLLLVVRAESADMIADVLGAGVRHQVKPLNRQDAIEAVSGPARTALRPYGEGAAEAIVTDLQTSRIEPSGAGEHYVTCDYVEPFLLQVVCARLWDSLPAGISLITRRETLRYGDADTALASHCGRVIAAVAEDHEVPVTRLRTWLQRTFITDLGTRGTAYEGATKTAGMLSAVARALEDRHLLTTERRKGARWYELLSDRLIEPVRQAADEAPPVTGPADYLEAAGRALVLGEFDLAERYARDTMRTSADTDLRTRAEVASLLGNLAIEREKPKDAEERYREAANFYEAVRDADAVARQLAAVGRSLVAQGELMSAVRQFRSALDRLPNDRLLQMELAMTLWQLGQGRGAVAVLTTVLEKEGVDLTALRARGEILADLGDARAALLDLDRVAAHAGPSTQAARGLALAEIGDMARARVKVEEALAAAPRSGPVLWYAARVSWLDGDKAAARELAGQAIDATDPALPPPHREAARQLGWKRNTVTN